VGDNGLRSIGDEMGTLVMAGDPVDWFETTYDEAKALGAMAIFGEKYGDHVRVVEVGDYSKELCGGTHVARTGDIGVVVLTSEGSVGANLRRIEALVGHEGLAYIGRRLEVLDEAARLLRGTPDDVADRIERLLENQRELEHKLARIERQTAAREAENLAAAAEQVDGVSLVVARRDGEVDVLRSLVQDLKGRLPSAVVVMGAAGQGRANLVAAVSKDVVDRGVSARDVLAPGARLLGGGAGGKPDRAISGGPAADKIDEALAAVGAEARNLLGR
jgi:alanyl-tRNA synthetase